MIFRDPVQILDNESLLYSSNWVLTDSGDEITVRDLRELLRNVPENHTFRNWTAYHKSDTGIRDHQVRIISMNGIPWHSFIIPTSRAKHLWNQDYHGVKKSWYELVIEVDKQRFQVVVGKDASFNMTRNPVFVMLGLLFVIPLQIAEEIRNRRSKNALFSCFLVLSFLLLIRQYFTFTHPQGVMGHWLGFKDTQLVIEIILITSAFVINRKFPKLAILTSFLAIASLFSIKAAEYSLLVFSVIPIIAVIYSKGIRRRALLEPILFLFWLLVISQLGSGLMRVSEPSNLQLVENFQANLEASLANTLFFQLTRFMLIISLMTAFIYALILFFYRILEEDLRKTKRQSYYVFLTISSLIITNALHRSIGMNTAFIRWDLLFVLSCLVISLLLSYLFIRIIPTFTPVRYSVRDKCLDLLRHSYTFTDRQEYTRFFLGYLTGLHKKHRVAFYSPDFTLGEVFAMLTETRLREVEAMIPARGGLNIDYELLNITPLTERLRDFDNNDMPHLILPLRDDAGALLGVFTFGRAPGLYWQDQQEKAFLAMIDVFRGFYLNMLAQESLRDQGEILVREQEARIYSEKLAETTAEQNRALEEANTRVMDSIRYASLIQRSILPPSEQLDATIPGASIVWRPRDIVGGDFYWMHHFDDGETVFAIVDCTGHGVPGALMSIAADSALKRVVRDQGLRDPAAVLTRLHADIGDTLHQQSDAAMQDGMDIGLIRIDAARRRLSFAGARIPLLVWDVESAALQVVAGTRHSVGGQKWREQIEFERYDLIIEKPVVLWLTTDGITDQPVGRSGARAQRLGSAAWREFAASLGSCTPKERKDRISELVDRLIVSEPQRDDICIATLPLKP
jgi:serine phosphatase RsbU (regulator of sigma subunit)